MQQRFLNFGNTRTLKRILEIVVPLLIFFNNYINAHVKRKLKYTYNKGWTVRAG